jgi:hypothetical protein
MPNKLFPDDLSAVALSEDDFFLISDNSDDDAIKTIAGSGLVTFFDGKYLNIANTDEFTPTEDYHPATKKYVDEAVATANEFIELTDCPASYVDNAGKFLRVNATPDGIEFISLTADLIGAGALNIGGNAFTVNEIEIVGADGEVNAAAIEDKFLRNDGDDTTSGTITAAGFTDGTATLTGGALSGITNIAGGVVFNEGGSDLDFRVESDTMPYAFFVDGTTGDVVGQTIATSNQHNEIGILLDILTDPRAIVGFTGTGADGSTEDGYESGDGRTWTYSGGLSTDKIFQGQTYVYSFDGSSKLSTPDTADMSFDDSGSNPFSIGGWIEVTDQASMQNIISKWDETTGSVLREWQLVLGSTEILILVIYDESENVQCYRTTDSALSVGWHFVVATYDSSGGATAGNGITIYVDGVAVASTAVNNASYVAMENSTSLPQIGVMTNSAGVDGFTFDGAMGRLFVTAEELSAADVWKIYEKTRSFYNK